MSEPDQSSSHSGISTPSKCMRMIIAQAEYHEIFQLQQLETTRMAVDTATMPKGKLVIRNVGLLLSGDLERPILSADAVVAVDGVIRAVGREKDLDTAHADLVIDAKGTCLAP